jgi:hypothetical protein
MNQIKKDYDALIVEGSRMAEAIRTAVMLNPDATLAEAQNALPDLHPGSIANRYRESKRVSKEMDG